MQIEKLTVVGSLYTNIYQLGSSAQALRMLYHRLMSLSKEHAIKKQGMQLIKLMKQIIVVKHLVRCEFEN